MKAAVIFFVPSATSAVSWRWRSADGTADSHRSFTYYVDCLADARAWGYDLETAHASARAPLDITVSAEEREQYERFLAAKPGSTRH